MRIALLGTRGVPAQYGGFETAVEEVGARLAEAGHDVTVYCRNPGQKITSYRGMRLVNLPAARRKSLETLSHTGLSVLHALVRRRPDVAILFNAGNAPLLTVLKAARVPTAVHVDGLEWQRAKWQGFAKRYYRWAERRSVLGADVVIADAAGIADHVRTSYDTDSTLIAYGAPILDVQHDRLHELGLEPRGYHLVVARLEPENHVDVVVEGYRRSDCALPLVVVGSAPYAQDYVWKLQASMREDNRIHAHGAVWDQELLDQLYGGCLTYVHGHSVGGTNPSLLRAMGAGSPVLAWDVVFNREVTGGHAHFFTTPDDVALLLVKMEHDVDAAVVMGAAGRARVATEYRWDDVAAKYLAMAQSLAR